MKQSFKYQTNIENTIYYASKFKLILKNRNRHLDGVCCLEILV